MKLLITGHRGLIGRQLFEYFSSLPTYNVVGADFLEGCDLTKEEAVLSFVRSLKSRGFEIDYVLQAHGLNHHIQMNDDRAEPCHWLTALDHDHLTKFYQVNVVSVNNVFKAVIAEHMTVRAFCTLASMYASKQPRHPLYDEPKSLSYVVSKHALVGLNNYYASYCGIRNIRFNLVSPGCIEASQPDSFKRALTEFTPMGRLSSPKDLFGVTRFLCSDASSYLTGANIQLDGGSSLY